jgi:transcription antitermination protein NusB
MKRREAREKAFQILFQMDINEISPEEALNYAADEGPIDEFTDTLVKNVIQHKAEIDQVISEHLVSWSLKRIASVERTLLRIATYEIKFIDDIPVKVSINEAVDIAKEYGDENSGKFINGVLSKLVEN